MWETARILYRGDPRSALVAVLLSFLAAGATTALVELMRRVGSTVDPSRLLAPFALALVLRLVLLAAAACAVHFWVATVMEQLRGRLASTVAALDLMSRELIGEARLVGALTEDATIVAESARALVSLVVNGATVACVALYVLITAPLLGLLGLAMLAVSGLLLQLVARRAPEAWARVIAVRSRVVSELVGLVKGASEIRQHAARRRSVIEDSLTPQIAKLHEEIRRYVLRFEVASRGAFILFFMMLGASVFLGPALQEAGFETSAAVSMAILFAMAPVESLVTQVPEVANAGYVLAELRELGLAHDAPARGASGHRAASSAPRRVALVGARCTKKGEGREPFELGPVDLELRAGELVFLTGGNGSGKSTCARLVAGLYEMSAGRLEVDGVAVEDLDEYRSNVSAVFTEFHVFARLYGIDAERRVRAPAWLDKLGLADKVHLVGDRFSTTALSSGQLKRLAFLVTALEDRPIVVLDEWAAEQDPSFRRSFYRTLLPELAARGKLVLVVSHDDAYFDVADVIVQMEEGKVTGVRRRREGSR